MTFVIGKECIDVLDRSCVDVCPVDCIFEGVRKNYIDPAKCIDCGECETVCPELAIFPARKARTDEQREFLADNAAFFAMSSADADEQLDSPFADEPGVPRGVDTPLVTGWPAA